MPQIFHRSFNVISRATIFGALFILAGTGYVWAQLVRSDYFTGAGVNRDQPVQFSHQHHVSGLGIDCRYCHTSAENSHFAGVPPTRTCMNCHSQIWTQSFMLEPVRDSYKTNKPIKWNRVHNLAEFVYFDHSIHVNKGVGCATCHGRVDQMPLTRQVVTLHMDWCLDCHREPEKYVRPKDKIYDMAWKADNQLDLGKKLVLDYKIERKTDCSTCHR